MTTAKGKILPAGHDIERWNVKTKRRNTLSVFYNRTTNLLVIDVVDADETGGNEIVRMQLREPSLLKHCPCPMED